MTYHDAQTGAPIISTQIDGDLAWMTLDAALNTIAEMPSAATRLAVISMTAYLLGCDDNTAARLIRERKEAMSS